MLLFILLEVLIFLGFGSAIFMAIKNKNNATTIIKSDRSDLDVEALAIKIAEAVAIRVAKEFIDKLGKVGFHGAKQSPNLDDVVAMDDSIIPISVNTNNIELSNLNLIKEEVKVDKDLDGSKNKLAEFLGKKKG